MIRQKLSITIWLIITITLPTQTVISFSVRSHKLMSITHAQRKQQQHPTSWSLVSVASISDDVRLREPQQQQQHENETPSYQPVESTTTLTKQKSWTDDGFIFGLSGSGLQRPKGKTPLIVVEGDFLETKPYQRMIVGTTFLAHTYFMINSFSQMLSMNHNNILLTCCQSLFLILSSWIIADFGSGVLHWSVDNYGNGKTPIMGGIIAAFQGHHTAPWTITQRGFCNNVYKLCIPFGIIPMMIISSIASSYVTFFMTFFCIFEILSQEFHKWSHQLPSETPSWGNLLQRYGFTVSRTPHAQHHVEPFEGNYCIISGWCNNVLDQSGFFRRMEHIIYRINGVEANSWKLDPTLRAKTLAGDYQL